MDTDQKDPGQALALGQTTLPASAPNGGLAWQRDQAEDIARRYKALSLALTVTRPASFSDAVVGDWLDAAVDLTADIQLDVLELAAREAGKSCRHPSQIVPTMHERAGEIVAARDRQRRLAAPMPTFEGFGDEQRPPKRQWSREEIEECKQAGRAMWEREQQRAREAKR